MSLIHTRIMRVPDIVPLLRLSHGTVAVRAMHSNVVLGTDSLPFNEANCEANPNFKPVASGGDGDSIQYCKTLALCEELHLRMVYFRMHRVRWI